MLFSCIYLFEQWTIRRKKRKCPTIKYGCCCTRKYRHHLSSWSHLNISYNNFYCTWCERYSRCIWEEAFKVDKHFKRQWEWRAIWRRGLRLLELEGLQSALAKSILCKGCGEGPIIIKEDFTRQKAFVPSQHSSVKTVALLHRSAFQLLVGQGISTKS